MKSIRTLVATCFCLFGAAGVQAQIQSTTSRMYLFNPNPADIKNSIDGLEAAISSRNVRPSKEVGLVPSQLPDQLGEPASKSVNFGLGSIRVLECGDSYGRVSSRSSSDGGLLGSSGENFFGCAYLSKQGITLAVILEQHITSSGLFGSLLSGIRDSIRGNDQKFGREVFDKMAALVREKVPGILIELPGGDISRPDADRVAAALAAPQAATPKLPSASAIAVDASAAVAAVSAAQPASGAEPQNVVANNLAQATDARKQLTSIGLQYFSVGHFPEAIQRRDTVAIQLFRQADAVNASFPGPSGKSAIDLAAGTGHAEIIRLIGGFRQ